LARKRRQIGSLYELTTYLSKAILNEEERQILYGKAFYLAMTNSWKTNNIFLENIEISFQLFDLLNSIEKGHYNFHSINQIFSERVKKQSRRLKKIVEEDIKNQRAKRVLHYFGSNLSIQNTFRNVGDTFETALDSRDVREVVENWRKSQECYAQFMLTDYKRKGSIDNSIRRIIETEMNQIDIYLRRYLNPST